MDSFSAQNFLCAKTSNLWTLQPEGQNPHRLLRQGDGGGGGWLAVGLARPSSSLGPNSADRPRRTGGSLRPKGPSLKGQQPHWTNGSPRGASAPLTPSAVGGLQTNLSSPPGIQVVWDLDDCPTTGGCVHHIVHLQPSFPKASPLDDIEHSQSTAPHSQSPELCWFMSKKKGFSTQIWDQGKFLIFLKKSALCYTIWGALVLARTKQKRTAYFCCSCGGESLTPPCLCMHGILEP